ncbi:N-acetyltransferase [Heyndrickxia sporothermodurans]|nr:N-acetyltransferase [Heyndrickxia sporothermodurans]
MNYLLRNKNLAIRKMAELDFPLMTKWLSDKNVLKYYGDPDHPFDSEKVIKKYLPRVQGKISIIPCIIEYKQQEIGFIQYYLISNQQLNDYGYKNHKRTFGIDQFIGETDYWSKGIGTDLVQAILHFLFTKLKAERVILDPHLDNIRAIRCYEKCGFKKLKELPNQLLLMECVKKTYN